MLKILLLLLLFASPVSAAGPEIFMMGGDATPSGPALKGASAWTNIDGAELCVTDCTVTLDQTASVGDTVVAAFMTNWLPGAACSDSGSNTYTVQRSFGGSGSQAICYAINISNAATTITMSTGSGGGGILGVAHVVSGVTALDGTISWVDPNTTDFVSDSITPTANGIAVSVVFKNGALRPVTFDAPWSEAVTVGNGNGFDSSFSARTTTSGNAFAAEGSTTTNDADALVLIHVK